MFNILNLGKSYIKLVQAKHTEYVEDLVKYDGENTELLECYITEAEDCTYADAAEIADKVAYIETVETVAVMGGAYGDTRCYNNSITVLVLEDNTRWMDAEYCDMIFA